MIGMESIGEAVSRVGAPVGATPRLIAVMVETADGLHAVHRIPEPDGKMPEVIEIGMGQCVRVETTRSVRRCCVGSVRGRSVKRLRCGRICIRGPGGRRGGVRRLCCLRLRGGGRGRWE